jgi:hypothetical protein
VNRRAFDAFLFCDELDLLEARLIELDSAVYRHVLVEAPVTFQGTPKPLHYAENRDRFAPWADKIIHVVADLDGCADHWAREHASREAIWQGLGELGGDDIFLLSDADEIPRAGVLQDAPGHVLAMRSHPVAVNLLDSGWWTGTMACLGRPSCTMQQFRDKRMSAETRPLGDAWGWVRAAGWHFVWLGGPDAMRAKVRSFAHPEQAPFVDAGAEELYRRRLTPSHAPDLPLLQVVIDESFPRFMQERRGPAAWYWPGQPA